jgi:hypothetical protein
MGEPPLEPAVQMSDKEELEGVNETMLDAPGIEAFEETDEVDDVCVAAGPVPTAFTAATDTV